LGEVGFDKSISVHITSYRQLISPVCFHVSFGKSNILCAMTTCAECGYTYERLPTGKLAGTLRDMGPRYRDALASADAGAARTRPAPTVWSALEYACHMRDVLLVQRDRAVVALVEDSPAFARMYRDERVELCRYSNETIEQVLDELDMSARLCATVFDGLGQGAWERPLVYNLPSAVTEGPVDVAWLARHTVHEGEHHLMDVNRALTGAAGPDANRGPGRRPPLAPNPGRSKDFLN
jgi:DinB superfamily